MERTTRILSLALTLTACSPGADPIDERLSSSIFGDSAVARPDIRLDAATRSEIIDDVISRLRVAYIFPEMAEKMENAVRARLDRGEYDQISSSQTLADSLTLHLRAVSLDRHLHVFFSPETIEYPTPLMRQSQASQVSYGIEKVERLPGNVGYIELRGFFAVGAGVEQAVAVSMDTVASTDALIIDLRRNTGGDPSMAALVASYLLGPERIHLTSIENRLSNRVRQYWTTDELTGPRYGPERPAYLLTSRQTFSGAEDFTYSLKALGRVTIVGETTGGGAHPTTLHRVTDHIGVRIPTGRAVNAITGTNWEITGVEPHLPVPQEESLRVAHIAALQAVLATADAREHKDLLERLIHELSASN